MDRGNLCLILTCSRASSGEIPACSCRVLPLPPSPRTPPDSCGVLNTVGNLLGGGPCQFDGCLLFDECHKAKNLGAHPPTKVGLAVAEIQELLPNARVIYCSA